MWWFIMSGSPEVYRLTSVKCSSLPKEAQGSAHSWDINQTHLCSPTSGSSSAGWGEQRNTCLLVAELMGQRQISLLKFDMFNYKVAEEQKYFSGLSLINLSAVIGHNVAGIRSHITPPDCDLPVPQIFCWFWPLWDFFWRDRSSEACCVLPRCPICKTRSWTLSGTAEF